MSAYILRRLIQALFLSFGVSVLVFVALQMAPGDPATLLVDPSYFTPQQLLEVRASLGLEDPWPQQYIKTMSGMFNGELRSFRSREPAMDMVMQAMPVTLKVVVGGVLLSILFGIPLGIAAAYRPGSWIDNFLSFSMAFALSAPPFVLALVLVRIFAEAWRILPASGMQPAGATSVSLLTSLAHLTLPSVVTAIPIAPILARYTRDALREVLQEEYIRTASAKGLARMSILARHMIPNVMVPLLSVLGIIIPMLLGGSAIVESVFTLPGIGRVAVQSALLRDFPVVMTTTIVSTLIIVASNLLTDVLYFVVDPRLRPR